MKPIYAFIIIISVVLLSSIKFNFCFAEDRPKIKTVKELIHNNLMEDGYSEEKIFAVLFQMLLEEENTLSKLNSGELIIGKRGPQLTEEEYFALFGRHLEQDAVNQYQYKMEQALVDSVCAFYGIERNKLIKIKQNKHLIDRKKKEIITLFETCIKPLNEKINKDRERQKQNELADLVVKKLEEKNNTSSVPLAPTLPDDMYFNY